MRWNLNSRQPCAVDALRAHLEAERADYLRINYEKPDVPTTAAERAEMAKGHALVGAEMARGIDAAVALATAQGGAAFHASLSAYGYPAEHTLAGRRSITVSVDQA